MRLFNNSKPKDKKWGEKKQVEPAPARPVQKVATTTQKQSAISKTVTNERTSPVEKKEPKAPRVIDPELEFQMMYGYADLADEVPKKNENVTADSTVPVKRIAPAGTGTGATKTFFPKTVYKKLVNKKLNIVLIESTALVSKEKEKVMQIVNRFLNSDLLCVINYGETVGLSEILEVKEPDKMNISFAETEQEKTCLYDALVEIEKLVSSKYLVTEEKERERVSINQIEIIGIGTCRDNCSTATKENALEAFFKICLKSNIATKYYCLTDEYVMNAAEIGFHSIGSISIAYQS